jgi:HEPN domain-containing protein
MINQERINLLMEQADDDLGAAEALQKAGYYGHALFWAHLVLEKMCKALWIKNNNSVEYPRTHSLIKLFRESKIELSIEKTEFYAEMNQFQITGRYDDTLQKIEFSVSEDTCQKFMEILKTEKQWIKTQILEK